MRLFLAINFNNEVKDKISEIQRNLQQYAIKANFTKEENLHLTLVFMGEVEERRVPSIEEVLNKISTTYFQLTINDVGYFQRNNGDIWWLGIKKNPILLDLQNKLSTDLEQAGFQIEKRKFTPHLTLAREVILDHHFKKSVLANTINMITVDVNKISLMRSERIDGKLVYTEIYGKQLERG